MRQLHVFSIKPKHDMRLFVDFYVFYHFSLNLPELNLKLFYSADQNNFRFISGKFRGKHRNQQTISCQIFAQLKNYGAVCYLLSCNIPIVSASFSACLHVNFCKTELEALFTLILLKKEQFG